MLVNGKRVNIPSYQVRQGDVVEVAEKAKDQLRIKGAVEAAEQRGFPEWLEVDAKGIERHVQSRAAALRTAVHDQRIAGGGAVFEVMPLVAIRRRGGSCAGRRFRRGGALVANISFL